MEKIKDLISTNKTIILFCFWGVMTTAVNLVIYRVCELMMMGTMLATFIAWIGAVTFAFVVNKQFVFESRSWEINKVLSEASSFYGGRTGTGILEMIGMYIFVERMGFDGLMMKIILSVIITIINYLFGSLLVFGNNEKHTSKETVYEGR